MNEPAIYGCNNLFDGIKNKVAEVSVPAHQSLREQIIEHLNCSITDDGRKTTSYLISFVFFFSLLSGFTYYKV